MFRQTLCSSSTTLPQKEAQLSGLPDLPLAHAVGQVQDTVNYCRKVWSWASRYEQSHSHREDCNASSSDINGDDNGINGMLRLRFGARRYKLYLQLEGV